MIRNRDPEKPPTAVGDHVGCRALVRVLRLSCSITLVTLAFGTAALLSADDPARAAYLPLTWAAAFTLSAAHARRHGPEAPGCVMADGLGMLYGARIVLLLLGITGMLERLTGKDPHAAGIGYLLFALLFGGFAEGIRWGRLAHRFDVPVHAVPALLRRAAR